jgi:predicted phosphodiesterase
VGAVTIVALADTHMFHDELVVPPGDVLVHAGDMTRGGTVRELRAAAEWIASLPHPHKLVVAGNHELCLEREPDRAWPILAGLTVLHDSAVTVAGLRFWGSPWQPWFCDWAFNLPRGPALAEKWARIPLGTDVLVTHGPPRGFGDRVRDSRREGCDDLLARVREVRPLVHVFGHIHEDRGAWRDGETWIVNATTAECEAPPTVIRIDPATRAVEVSQ